MRISDWSSDVCSSDLVAGDIAVVAKLPNYRLDPAFAGLFDGNPYHDAAADPMGLPRTPLVEYIRPPPPPAPPPPRYGTAVSGLPFPSQEVMARRILEAVGAGTGLGGRRLSRVRSRVGRFGPWRLEALPSVEVLVRRCSNRWT